MRGQGARQTGFSAIAIVIAVVVVGVIAVSGLLVYQHHRRPGKQTANANSSQTTSQQKSPASAQQHTAATLDIKDWGVHLTLDNITASMYYYIKPDLPNVAYVSLGTISGIDPDCAADKTALGAISRLTEAEQQSIVSDPTKGTPGTIHIGNYWYDVQNSHAACINATQDAAIQKALPGYNSGEIVKALNTLAADPTAN